MAEQETKQQPEFQHLVRIAQTDLKGQAPLLYALTNIHGMSVMYANAILHIAQVPKNKRVGYITENEVKKIEAAIENKDNKIPQWLKNRKKDPETGVDKHLLTSDLKFTKDNDIKLMKKIRSYKGVRHMFNLPVRGQRTKGHFRHGKSLGVSKKSGKSGRV